MATKMLFQITAKTSVVVEVVNGKMIGTEYTEGVVNVYGHQPYEVDAEMFAMLVKLNDRYNSK
jgi:hypothetical protein